MSFEEAILHKLSSNPLHDDQRASDQFNLSTGGCDNGCGVGGRREMGFAVTGGCEWS